MLGFAAGGAAYGPAPTDLVILAPEGRIFVTGPDVVRSVTGEDVDMLRLSADPDTHGRRSGVVHVVADDEPHALARAGALPPCWPTRASTADHVGRGHLAALLESPKRAYDVHPLIDAVLDEGYGRAARPLGPERDHRPGPAGRADRRRDRQQPAPARWLSGLRSARRRRPGSSGCATPSGFQLIVLVDVPGYLPGVGQSGRA